MPSRSRRWVRRRFATAAIASRAIEFLLRRADVSGDIYPDDSANGYVDGPDPVHVVFVGERGEMCLGVRTHELSLPAFFARRLAASSGRGVSWAMRVLPRSLLEAAPAVVRGIGGTKVDAVVILAGVTDTLRVTSTLAWSRQVCATIEALHAEVGQNIPVLIADIPPLDGAGSMSRLARVAAGIHSRAANRATREVALLHELTETAAFPDELTDSFWRPGHELSRYRDTYRIWGTSLADGMTADATESGGMAHSGSPAAR